MGLPKVTIQVTASVEDQNGKSIRQQKHWYLLLFSFTARPPLGAGVRPVWR